MTAFLMLCTAAGWAQDARVEQYPIDAERFRPPADPFGYAVTESATTLDHLQVGVGIWGNYSDDPAVLYVDNQRLIGPSPSLHDAMIAQKSVMDFQLGLGLGRVFGLMVDGPVVLWQSGFEPAAEDSPVPVADPLSSGMGDLRITPKFVLVNLAEGSPVGLSLYATGTVPLGSTRSLVGEGTPTIAPMVAFEAASGPIRTGEYTVRGAFNLGARIKQPDRFRDVIFGNEFLYRVALSAKPVELFEVGVDLAGAVGGLRVALAPVEILPWMRFHGGEIASLSAGAGLGLNPGLGSPDFRVFAGTTLAPKFGPADRDGDGVLNRVDSCPNVPEDLDGFQDEDGCPDDDNDGDGILDPQDSCPNEPEDRDGFQDVDGCPELDNDGDGIVDTLDSCPIEPEDLDGFQDQDGCPDPDNDGDGIADPLDKCPMEPETMNGQDDQDGCPDSLRVVVTKEKIVITEKVFFEYNKAIIQEMSFELLGEVARIINSTPRIKLIQVEGHTDSDGGDSYNLKLSQSRAESVLAFLVRSGVDTNRLVARGFGESVPIDSNGNAAGKARNRRVEFVILQQDE